MLNKGNEIVKVNKLGISLLIVIFLLDILIMIDINLGIVNATADFFYSPEAQFSSPGTYRSFSQAQASTYWPALGDKDKCEAVTDFLMYIRPGSCTPQVVRSDLLEEQNVPIFCKVDIVKLNPLVDVSRLKSVKFEGDYGEDGKYIAGVSFHPNNEAVYSQREFLENPLINDIGYVVVVLKRIDKEKDMPESVKINLTGVLGYDAEGVFGAGKNIYYLEPLEDEEWETGDTFKNDLFFKGKGYLRADWISGNQAKISIYRDKEEKLASFTIEKGKTSDVYYMPGFYCRVGVKIRLDDVAAPVGRVKLQVDDNILELVKGEKFLDNLCTVSNIKIDETNKEKSVSISCKGASKTLSYKYTEGIDEKQDEKIVEKEAVEQEDAELDEKAKELFEQAREYAQEIEDEYDGVATEEEVWAAKAFFQLGELAEKLGQKRTAIEIYTKVINDYPNSFYAGFAEDNLKNVPMPFSEHKGHKIKLLSIRAPTKSEASADFTIKKDGKEVGVFAVQEQEKFGEKGKENEGEFKLLNLYPDKVYVEYTGEKKDKDETTRFYLSYEDSIEKRGDYEIRLENITLNQVAKVSVISDVKTVAESEFLFKVGIEKRGIKLSPEKTKDMIKNLNESIEKWQGIVDKLGNVVKGMKGACFATWAVLMVRNFFANLGGGATARQAVMPRWYAKCQKEAGNDENLFNKCLKDNELEIENDVKAYTADVENTNKLVIGIQNENKYASGAVNRKASAAELLKTFPDTYSYDTYEYDTEGEVVKTSAGGGSITKTELENAKTSLTDLRDLKLYENIKNNPKSSEILKQDANLKMDKIVERLKKQADPKLGTEGLTAADGKSWLNSVRTIYSSKGKVQQVPIPGVYGGKTGFYAVLDDEDRGLGEKTGHTAASDIVTFTIKQVSKTQTPDENDRGDPVYFAGEKDKYLSGQIQVWELQPKEESIKLVKGAVEAIKKADESYGKDKFILAGETILIDKGKKLDEKRCQDFMSPGDCYILFNLCDPVICPASRCDLGGAYRVDNVIQSGIIGSIALCLPNAKEGIIVPVCISGVQAGLDAYLSILKNHRDCLQERLKTGKNIGVCDEIYSIYLCEFFWRNAAPFLDRLLLNMIEQSQGQGMKGGGEYLTVQDAWLQTQSSINFMKNDYAVNSYKAFQARSWDDIGTGVCKMFVSAKYPTNKDFFDNLIEPDSPEQYSAWFDEIPYTEATVPATSQYKVFYHIYAGKDIGASFQVYLKNPSQSAYVHVQETIIVDSGYIPRGGYASQTRDFTAPVGYKELCVRINGKDDCGFKKVSTSYALNYLSDMYYEDQLTGQTVTTEKECISGTPSAYSLLQPNIQEGAQQVLTPSLQQTGVVRVCSQYNPGQATKPQKWKEVGYCDKEEIKCWIDLDSVKDVIKNKNLTDQVIQEIKGVEQVDVSEEVEKLRVAKEIAKEIMDKIKNWINEKRKAIVDSTAKEATANSILVSEKEYIKKLVGELDGIEETEAENKVKAEAVYLKFRIYKTLAEGFVKESKMPAASTTSELEAGSIVKDADGIYWMKSVSGDYWYKVPDKDSTIDDIISYSGGKKYPELENPILVRTGTQEETTQTSSQEVPETKPFETNPRLDELKEGVDILQDSNTWKWEVIKVKPSGNDIIITLRRAGVENVVKRALKSTRIGDLEPGYMRVSSVV